jgi:hypothetical protein
MLQSWILPRDVNPFANIHTGQDSAVCGDCPLRGIVANGRNTGRACYVQVGQAPLRVWRSYHAGRYEPFTSSHLQFVRGRALRIGAFGEPVAVPYGTWSPLVRVVSGWTGYSHQWGIGRFWRILMASCETLADAREAQSRGGRTFRTGSQPAAAEFVCPASAERGHKTTCERCLACAGQSNGMRRNVVIAPHGRGKSLPVFQEN